MVNQLTPEQIAKMPSYADKWTKVGLDTTRFTEEEAEAIIHPFQTEILGGRATPVEVYDDPKQAWAAVVRHTGTTESFVTPYQTGSFFVNVFSFYDYFIGEGLVELPPDLLKKYKIWEATSKLGFIYPLEDVCIVSQKPSKISLNEKGQLHCEDGPSVEYPSGWKMFSLNGITVPESLVMTPSEDLSIEFFKNETNADVKAEFVRKYGVERMLDLGKKVDSYEKYDQEENPWWWKSGYELWDMASIFPGLTYQPFLKMVNQTTGILHVEACSTECRT
jgi:hypothetical protein